MNTPIRILPPAGASPPPPPKPRWPLVTLALLAVLVGSCNGYQFHLERQAALAREREAKAAAEQEIKEAQKRKLVLDSLPDDVRKRWEKYDACKKASDNEGIVNYEIVKGAKGWMQYCLTGKP